ncbi:hypothetical protein ACEPAH_6993 [Sanghuangporus vaninii]
MSTGAQNRVGPTGDPFELDRLAEELAAREGTSTAERASVEVDLPELQPLTHDNKFLSAPNFNVEEFLLSRSNTSLPDLRTELREYLAKLKEELVKLINDDYEAFISLSTDLQGEGARLERIKQPLGGLGSQIQESKDQLQSIQDSVKARLDRRAALREEKALLQLLLKISDSIARLESLLLISSPQDISGQEKSLYSGASFPTSDVLDDKSSKGNRAKHLLRIASEYNQLLYHANKASSSNCTFVAENQRRIERIKSTLTSDLEHHFTTTLLSLVPTDRTLSEKAKRPEVEHARLMLDLADCLRAYDMLGLWRDAEDVIRREIVRAFVKKTIYPGCLSGPRSPLVPPTPFLQQASSTSSVSRPPPTPFTPYTALTSKQTSFFSSSVDLDSNTHFLDDDDTPLTGLYNQILRFVSTDMRPIMEAAERIGSKGSRRPLSAESVERRDDESDEYGFDILSNVIWTEVSRAIMDDLGSAVFAVGKLDEFLKNYERTQAFIRSLEYLAPSLQSVKAFREHPALEAFERRWQLPVYFQLRWKDIVSRVEEALESKTLSPTGGNTKSVEQPQFALVQSMAIWNALNQCWNTEIYLTDLGPRFWKLTLQLIKRYRTWIESSMPPFENASKKQTISDKASGTDLPGSRSSTPGPGSGQEASLGRAADDDKHLQQCALLMQDIKEMELAVMQLWTDKINAMLPQNAAEDDTSGPENALKSALSSVTEIIGPLSSQVEAILTGRCCDALAPVKTLAGQFRAAPQKYMPAKPSPFVPLILRPVKVFFGVDRGGGEGKALRKDFCIPMSTNIVEAVSNKYLSQLAGMRRAEESLRRLKIGKRHGFSFFGGSGPGPDEDNRDDERLRAQLILDVTAFGQDAEALGVNLENCTSFKALEKSVHANTGALDSPAPS